MKKIVLSVAVLCCSATMFAGNRSADSRFDMNMNVEKLGNYLMLDETQASQVKEISAYFTEQMNDVKYARDTKKPDRVKTAVYSNLRLMKETLTPEQYSKYLRLVNVTFRNRGLDTYMIAVK